MYPSAFCQPSYRQSCNETWVRRSRPTPERSYANQPFIHLSSHHQPQPSYTTTPNLDRSQYLQLLHHQSQARAHRRTLLARQEAERQVQRQRHQQAELRAYYLAEREARLRADREATVRADREARLFVDRKARRLAGQRAQAQEERRRRMREERAEFVELIDGLFNGITRSYANADGPRAEEPLETPQAQQFSDSESEDEEEEDAMRGLLNSFLHGFGLQDQSDIPCDTNVGKPSDNEHAHDLTPAEPYDAPQETEDPLQAIREAYTANKARVQRLETLDALHQNLVNLVEEFTLPPSLDFTATTATNEPSIPELKFTSRNTPYHAHAQSLLGLLVEADAVASDGDEEVRARRKEFVGLVEGELDALEGGKRRVWEEQRGRD